VGALRDRRRAESEAASRRELAEAGDLLPVEAIDRGGLLVTSEGAFVRIISVTPPNPLILSAEERERVARAYGESLARLRAGQSVQCYVHSRPADLERLLGEVRGEVEHFAGHAPTAERNGHDPLALDRWRLYAAMEQSLRLHADTQAAVRTSAYLVVPYLPAQRGARALASGLRSARGRLACGALERDLRAHRRAARESLALAESLRADLDALDLPTKLLNGWEVAELLWARFVPTAADAARRPPPRMAEIIGGLDAPVELEDARRAARSLRAAIARASLDFKRSKHHAEIERDLEQVIYVQSTADATYMGWLLGAMLTRQPFALAVHVHALDRRRERQRLKLAYRRRFAINRGAESRGRVIDHDRYAQEREHERMLAEMSGHERAGVYRVSIYQALRAPGPEPDQASLAEAVEWCAAQIEASSDARVNRGAFQQQELWLSTLPLGRDVAARTRKYATRNVGDHLPLIGTGCGSPRGIPFAFTSPGRTLELLDPFDRAHANHTMVVSGTSGSGKTMLANTLLARCLACGARAFVIDRAGHYATLAQLLAGARQIEIGADDSPYAINPWDVPDPGAVSREKVTFLVSLHQVMMGAEGLSVLERSHLAAAIRAVYARCAVDGRSPREALLREELLARAAHERDHAQGDPQTASALRHLAERLGEFCGQGIYAYLLDKPTSVPADSPLVIFDTRRCPDLVLAPVMFAIVEFVTRQVEAHRDRHHQEAGAALFAGRSMLVIDEGWKIVESDATGAYANDLARRGRHLGLFLLVLSQQLSDFDTEHGRALIANCTMQVILAQRPDQVPFVQRTLRLSEEEAAHVRRLKTVKGAYSEAFWVNGTRGRGVVALRVGPLEYWAFTSDQIRDRPLREAKIAAHHGQVWPALYELASEVPPLTGGR
jgi:hypothetical protein